MHYFTAAGLRQLSTQCINPGCIAETIQRDCTTLSGQRTRDAQADTRSRSGNQRGLALKMFARIAYVNPPGPVSIGVQSGPVNIVDDSPRSAKGGSLYLLYSGVND